LQRCFGTCDLGDPKQVKLMPSLPKVSTSVAFLQRNGGAVRNRRNQWAAVFILHLALSGSGASQEQNTTAPVIPQTIHAPQIFAKAGLLRDEMSRIGLTFQGLYVNDWTFGSDGNEQDRWFGRYSFDFLLNVDGEKLVGWRGASASLRLKQHLPQFGDENSYSRVSQLYSNIDGNSRTSIYELWLQQTTLSNKLRVKVGKVDASSEFATVAIAADFLNASMGFSPTVMYFPTYPEPKPGIMSFVYPNDRYFVGAGVFRTNGDGTLSIAEGGVNWIAGHNERSGKATLGFWHLQQELACFDGDTAHRTHGFYSVLQQSLWRQTPGAPFHTREVSAFLQFGTGDGDMNPFTKHFGGGLVLNQPFSAHDAIGIGTTWVDFTHQPSAAFDSETELVIEAYYKVQIHRNVTLEPDFQFFHNPGGIQPHSNLLALTPRLILSF